MQPHSPWAPSHADTMRHRAIVLSIRRDGSGPRVPVGQPPRASRAPRPAKPSPAAALPDRLRMRD